MPTYAYETIPQDPDEVPRRFELFQKMSSPTLTHDPETGEAVRRVVAGPVAIKRRLVNAGVSITRASDGAGACGCGTGQAHGPKLNHNPLLRGKSPGLSAQTHSFGHHSHDHGHGHDHDD